MCPRPRFPDFRAAQSAPHRARLFFLSIFRFLVCDSADMEVCSADWVSLRRACVGVGCWEKRLRWGSFFIPPLKASWSRLRDPMY